MKHHAMGIGAGEIHVSPDGPPVFQGRRADMINGFGGGAGSDDATVVVKGSRAGSAGINPSKSTDGAGILIYSPRNVNENVRLQPINNIFFHRSSNRHESCTYS